jgi:acyl-CoA synthetase (AMP-forming)/AMP-acid ligase II
MLRSDLVQPVPELLRTHADRLPDRVAFRDADRAVDWAGLETVTRRLAGHLVDAGVARGDRVAFCLGNRVETVETWLAVTRAAAVGVPLNPRSTDAELAHLLDDSGAVLVVTDPGHLDQLRRLRADRPDLRILAFLKGLKQVDGWDKMPLTDAAQTVQVSAYPDAYAQWEKQATDIVTQHWTK